MSSEEKFDAIVVGGGLAGSAAALTMARAGLDVIDDRSRSTQFPIQLR